jgi:alpha-N-acetylglucosaminidase
MKRLRFAILAVLSTALFAKDSQTITAARQIIRRQIGAKADKIKINIVPKVNKCDTYSYSSKKGELLISGSSPVAIARGFYDYVRAANLGMVGWRGAELSIPTQWPDMKETSVTTPFQFNQMYNVVTAGYTHPYWGWKRWEHELDWLALHGYNMMLAPMGTEAILERVWLKLGLTQQEIDDFVCGPAHAPWERMGNIAKVDGPLPKDWHKRQVKLQHKILKRIKSLEITPVFLGFAGFVPNGMKRLYPDETYYQSHWNSGFRGERAPIYLLPESKLYKKIFKMYMAESQKEFGKQKYFLIDTFNELKELPSVPGKTTEEVMAEYGNNLSSQLTESNPDAVWAFQGWIFYYQRKLWSTKIVEALFSRVPNDKMLIFDMMGVWKSYNSFYGKPWIFGSITNMGGTTQYAGNFSKYVNGPAEVIASKNRGNCVGNSNHSESTETNEVIFELIADSGWCNRIDLDSWLDKFCRNRYGSCPPEMKEIWKEFTATVFKNERWWQRFGWQTFGGNAKTLFSERFMKAATRFLALHKQFSGSKFYVDDAIEIASFVLGQKADYWGDTARKALNSGNNELFDKASARAIELLLQADRLLESHALNRLQRWTDFATANTTDPDLKNYYEENAKRILTVWGPPINDYACRIWSGLIRDFYVPRLKASFARIKGKQIDRNTWEEAWLYKPGVSKIEPYPNPSAKAFELVTIAMNEKILTVPDDNNGPELGSWSPGAISKTWKTIEWEMNPELLENLKGVKFVYIRGHHAIEIKQVQLICDGNVVTTNKHPGLAGKPSRRNSFHLKVPKNIQANNGCLIRATVKGYGGTNSYGSVKLIMNK